MKIFDFNVHLPAEPDQERDFSISEFDFTDRLRAVEARVEERTLIGANVSVLDSRVLESIEPDRVTELSERDIYLTVLIDPLAPDAEKTVKKASDIGFRGIKFHPYHQNLVPPTYRQVQNCARRASEEGLWVTVCGSYGTRKLYDVNAVDLVISISDLVETPLILLHAGGKRVLEAMSVGLEQSNVYLETSFSLSFWEGSSVEKDMAFAFKKLGPDRVIYGSDHPYVSGEESRKVARSFFDKFGFSDESIEQIFSLTAQKLIS